jgi:organic radical activating enzyme
LNYKTDNGSETIGQESIVNFWYSKDRVNLIDRLESGERVPECSACWNDEDSGKKSYRQIINESWLHRVKNKNQLPNTAYLSLGNTCNLKCRICWIDRSSKFAEEEKNISDIGKFIVTTDKDLKTSATSFATENDNFWIEILKLLPEMTEICFSGGEPFYVKNNQKFTKYLIDLGYAKNIALSYNSNGTLYPEETIKNLNEFKSVSINLSIDGIHDKFDYLRHPGPFSSWEQTVDKFQHTHNNWHYFAVITVSMFNIWDSGETFDYCRNRNLPTLINFVYDDRSAKFMPDGLKKEVIERLMSHNSKYVEWISYRDNIINFLNNHTFDSKKWTELWSECRMRDEYRSESFQKTFPDYYEKIEKYL